MQAEEVIVSYVTHPVTKFAVGLAGIFVSVFVVKYLAKLLQWAAERFLTKKKLLGKGWLSLMTANKLFSKIFFAVGLLFVVSASGVFLTGGPYPQFGSFVLRLLNSVVIISFMFAADSFLSVISDRFSRSIRLPVKGVAQAAKVIFWIFTIFLIIATLINKNPMLMLGGLTALSAIIMLVFKDSILGLTSGFQLLLNDLVRVGDWIEIPSQGADGEVVDIMLTTVRVQNWDNTIVNVPAYDLVSHSFKNWRGMSESGGRRIKRAIKIDLTTIRFLEEDEIKRLAEVDLLREYLEKKQKEIKVQNTREGKEVGVYNARRLTNIGTFRAYCAAYLKNNPNISTKFTCMVRQLDPTSEGLPLEIYAFSADINWVNYENIQSDIFDHLLSIISLFGLKVYQRYGDHA